MFERKGSASQTHGSDLWLNILSVALMLIIEKTVVEGVAGGMVGCLREAKLRSDAV